MWQKKSSKTIFKHPRMTLVEDIVVLPDGKEIDYLVFGDYNDVVTVLVERQGKLLLLHEHAYPINKHVYQLVEGLLDDGEDWKAGARRELKEEAGLEAAQYEKIGEVLVHHRRTTAVHHVVVAKDTRDVGAAPELTEDMTSHWFAKKEIMKMIAAGKITQKNTLAAWSVYLANQEA